MSLRTFAAGPALPSVLVVAARGRHLASSLQALLKNKACLRWGSDLPPRLAPGIDGVVVDLREEDDPRWARVIPGLSCITDVWLVSGLRAVSPAYLAAAQCARVRVIQAPPREPGVLETLVASALLRWLEGPGPPEISQAIIQRESFLRPVAALVTRICEDPWGVRLPRDLAVTTMNTLGALRTQSRAVGFRRIEHFITVVRMLIYEQACRMGAPPGIARGLAGITDLSNWRRQLSRATVRVTRA